MKVDAAVAVRECKGGMEGKGRGQRVVGDVDDAGSWEGAEEIDEDGDVGFELGVGSWCTPDGVVEATLNVDEEEDGGLGFDAGKCAHDGCGRVGVEFGIGW